MSIGEKMYESEFLDACKTGNFSIASSLLNTYTVDNNREVQFGFLIASTYGHMNIVKAILDTKMLETFHILYSMDRLFSHGVSVEIANMLLDNDTLKNFLDKYYEEYFFNACANGHDELVKLLLEKYSNINVHLYNERAFVCACSNGQYRVVKILLDLTNDKRIDVHVNTDEAFRLACEYGKTEVVKLLLDLNDDRQIPLSVKYVGLELAKKRKCTQIVNLLEDIISVSFEYKLCMKK